MSGTTFVEDSFSKDSGVGDYFGVIFFFLVFYKFICGFQKARERKALATKKTQRKENP